MGMTASSASGKQPKPDINVTPLVDIVLVLLIIFMVVTPAMDEGEHVELPEISIVDEQKEKGINPIEITMAFNGNVLVDKQRIELKELKDKMKALHVEKPDSVVLLNADARLHYKVVRDTFKSLQDIGFKGVSLKVAEKKAVATASNAH